MRDTRASWLAAAPVGGVGRGGPAAAGRGGGGGGGRSARRVRGTHWSKTERGRPLSGSCRRACSSAAACACLVRGRGREGVWGTGMGTGYGVRGVCLRCLALLYLRSISAISPHISPISPPALLGLACGSAHLARRVVEGVQHHGPLGAPLRVPVDIDHQPVGCVAGRAICRLHAPPGLSPLRAEAAQADRRAQADRGCSAWLRWGGLVWGGLVCSGLGWAGLVAALFGLALRLRRDPGVVPPSVRSGSG